MSCSSEESGASTSSQKKYRGVRQRKWGKWVSEIRVPGTQERLWLGSYATPEAAAVARDVAFYCLHRPSSLDKLNFPLMLPSSLLTDMSPRSVQEASSDAGMGVDAQLIGNKLAESEVKQDQGGGPGHGLEAAGLWENVGDNCTGMSEFGNKVKEGEAFSISIDDYL
ncbi:hypothetical protein FH972_008104 [Carpinus fangiana]|uniref:AP2/ERF domain-containing protein n=1 Tax=Carpinus fangiana TaxID=176857 RepID=A0A5N6QXL7_9ROSI|nr:hypothetical protein FH972_008104 [Carpinus fangiana]